LSDHLTVIVKNFSTRRGELFPVLLEAGQHSEIALIQYRTAVPLNVAGASALLLTQLLSLLNSE
jgi:hypothetical protein